MCSSTALRLAGHQSGSGEQLLGASLKQPPEETSATKHAKGTTNSYTSHSPSLQLGSGLKTAFLNYPLKEYTDNSSSFCELPPLVLRLHWFYIPCHSLGGAVTALHPHPFLSSLTYS